MRNAFLNEQEFPQVLHFKIIHELSLGTDKKCNAVRNKTLSKSFITLL